jgi:hypothetical protein
MKKNLFLLFCLASTNSIFAQASYTLGNLCMARTTTKYKLEYNCWIKNDTLLFNTTSNGGRAIMSKVYPIQKINLMNRDAEKISLSIKCDTSGKEFNSRIYISWADQKNGSNNWDVFLIYSDDEGNHWTEPILVTYHPNHKNQYAPKLSVNQVSGALLMCYFDFQNDIENKTPNIYFAISHNGGLKFECVKLNNDDVVHDLTKDEALKKNIEQPTIFWSDFLSLKPSKYVFIKPTTEVTSTINGSLQGELEIDKTFLYKEKLLLNFVCKKKMKITAELTKPINPAFGSKVLFSKNFKKGNNQMLIDLKANKIEKGNYTLTLYFNNENKFVWITEE